jgi:hypothetical protein
MIFLIVCHILSITKVVNDRPKSQGCLSPGMESEMIGLCYFWSLLATLQRPHIGWFNGKMRERADGLAGHWCCAAANLQFGRYKNLFWV